MLGRIGKERRDLAAQNWEMGCDDVPHEAGVHLCIAVNEDVAECSDPGVLRDARGGFRVAARELGKRLADDLELPLDRRPSQRVAGVARQIAASRELRDAVRSLEVVIQNIWRCQVA
jgi:hypothetical protein